MLAMNLPTVESNGFAFKGSVDTDTISVQMSGTGDLTSSSSVSTSLQKLHTEATRLGVRSVVVNIKELYFLNSSCLKHFVSWLKNVREAGRARYEIHFVTNANLRWQRRSLSALRALGDGVVSVDE